MPLPFPNTIARDKVFQNVAALEREGHLRNQAIAKAFNEARKAYFKKFRQGLLPEWLAARKGMRSAQHYDTDGALLRGNPVHSPANARQKQASRLFKSFTGDAPQRAVRLNAPGVGFSVGLIVGFCMGLDIQISEGLSIGHLQFTGDDRPTLAVSYDGRSAALIDGDFAALAPYLKQGIDKFEILTIMYETVRDGEREKYRHLFAHKARPQLSIIDGRNAVMCGGAFRFTERGFVDFQR